MKQSIALSYFYMECNLSQKQYHMPREELVSKWKGSRTNFLLTWFIDSLVSSSKQQAKDVQEKDIAIHTYVQHPEILDKSISEDRKITNL